MSGDALVATLDLPRANGELVFDEPWQARALGMGVVTIEALGIGAVEWRDALADAITPGIDVYEGRTTCDGGFLSPLNHAPVNETGGWLWSCNFMVSASAYGRVNGFDEGFPFPHMEDQDLRERLKSAGFRSSFIRDAVVNHPPRRQPSGQRLGSYRRAEVRYYVKHHGVPEARSALYWRVARYRLGVIRDTPKSIDSIAAMWSLLRELAHMMVHVSEWERQAVAEFAAARGEA